MAAWVLVAGVYAVLLRYDIALMRWRNAVLGDEGAEGLLRQALHSFREFAHFMPIAVILIVVATYDRRRWRIIAAVLLAQLLAAAVYNSGKLLIPRYRPNAEVALLEDLSSVRPGQTWLGRDGEADGVATESFPSGHSAAAFALAGVLACYYRRLAWLLWVLAAGCALSRYLDAVHWPSDCLAGAAIGYASAWLALLRLRPE